VQKSFESRLWTFIFLYWTHVLSMLDGCLYFHKVLISSTDLKSRKALLLHWKCRVEPKAMGFIEIMQAACTQLHLAWGARSILVKPMGWGFTKHKDHTWISISRFSSRHTWWVSNRYHSRKLDIRNGIQAQAQAFCFLKCPSQGFAICNTISKYTRKIQSTGGLYS
jgi:hypothetical protein